MHTVRLAPLVPAWPLADPPPNDPVFKAGYPRHGALDTVDIASFESMRAKTADLDFSYGSGARHRMVVELTPDGPRMWASLPGGTVASRESRHFNDEMQLWRRNQLHAVPLTLDEVAAAYRRGDEHIRFTPED